MLSENCYNLLEDCDILVAEDETFCQSNIEANRICRQSCGFCTSKKPKSGKRNIQKHYFQSNYNFIKVDVTIDFYETILLNKVKKKLKAIYF